MANLMKIISFFYLGIITIALLVPIEFFVITEIVHQKNIPSNKNSYVIHFFIFFILCFLFYFSYSNSKKVLFFLIAYSLLIEILQVFTSRGFQMSDIICNLLGVIIAYYFIFIFKNLLR